MSYFMTEAERKAKHTSCCFEFQKGPYRGKHWLDSSISLHADIFDSLKLDELFYAAFPQFNYYGPTEVSPTQWQMLLTLSRQRGGTAEKVMAELEAWVDDCFQTEEVFTICGI